MRDAFAYVAQEVSRQLRKRYDVLAQDIPVGRPEWRVLCMLADREGTNQSSLADALAIEQITLVRRLDQLEADGLVERRLDPRDRRVRRLYLTPAARPMLARMRGVHAALEEAAMAGFSEESRAQLIELLDAVHHNLAGRPIEAEVTPESRLASFLG